MNKLTNIAISNRSAKNTATVHMLTVGGNNYMNKFFVTYQLVLALLFILNNLKAQNLVLNPDFEQRINNDFSGQIASWVNCTKHGTPDYFNFTDSIIIDKVNNYIFGIHPYSSFSSAGIFCYRRKSPYQKKDVREYLQAPLAQTLSEGETYIVEFYIVLDPESNIAIDRLGAHFSNNSLQNSSLYDLYKLKPQIENPRRSYCNNTKEWHKISGYFIANGSEKFIIIGNFKSDEDTKTIHAKNNITRYKKRKWTLDDDENVAYYYIDNVTVKNLKVNNDTVIKDSMEFAEPIEDNLSKLLTITKEESIILKNIEYDFDSSVLKESSYAELEILFQILNENKEIKIHISGHTDNYGNPEYNMKLSEERAQSVVSYLITKGIIKSRLCFSGYGETLPIQSNENEEGRLQNRRVEINIIE